MGNTNSTNSSINQNTESKNNSSSSTATNDIEISISNIEKTQARDSSQSVMRNSDSEKASKETPKQVSKAVPVATNGWVSSTTGTASPWFNSLSSSTSSYQPHGASVSGPYYTARGLGTPRDSENDEESNIPTNLLHQANSGLMSTREKKGTQSGITTIITWTQGGNNVYVTGSFNDWKTKIKLIKSTHDFNAVFELPPGTHRLKFIVDDEWKCSNDLETATNPDGNLVNYLQVMDENEDDENDQEMESATESLCDDSYTTEIPPEFLKMAKTSEGDLKSNWEKKQPQPPKLPPHLDKISLNSQAMSEMDNSVLNEPNHVTLNHLYACPIKDNVLALAATTRYRQKYVTTMYYRPVSPKD